MEKLNIIPLSFRETLNDVFKTVYQISISGIYSSKEKNAIHKKTLSGSGILFEGGYFLTAAHTLNESQFEEKIDTPEGPAEYLGSTFFIKDEKQENKKIHGIEKLSLNDDLDYALLRISDEELLGKLPKYKKGINFPNDPWMGMTSVVMGYSLGIKNLRFGNLSYLGGYDYNESINGSDYYLFSNSILTGDSGGPIFVLEDEELKLAAIVSANVVPFEEENLFGHHPTNIVYGIRADSIKKDLERKLSLEKVAGLL